MACRERLIGIAGTNAFPAMPPGAVWGTSWATTPAVDVPCEGEVPFVPDMAMSVSPRGRMREMAERQRMMPVGRSVENKSRPSTDPLEGIEGFVLPMGQHEGHRFAIAVDILGGVLTGSGFATGVKSLVYEIPKF